MAIYNSFNWQRAGSFVVLGLGIMLWGLVPGQGISPALAGNDHRHMAIHQHVVPMDTHRKDSTCLGRLTKHDYGTQVFQTRFRRPGSSTSGRLMVYVDVAEKWPVIINTIQIRHKGERVAYTIGRRMGQGWNEIPLDHIPWKGGELRVSMDHGRGSRVVFYLAADHSRRPNPATRQPHRDFNHNFQSGVAIHR